MALSLMSVMALGSSPRVRGAEGLDDAGNRWDRIIPRVRGAVSLQWTHTLPSRIIPARAGSSVITRVNLCVLPDHPRACGEQSLYRTRNGLYFGSSPRVRGAVHLGQLDRPVDGIIPARAGSRRTAARSSATTSDHPRACGEQIVLRAHLRTNDGSSPRVRGAVQRHSHERGVRRIIPARAGSRSRSGRTHLADKDHPRACGEQTSRTSPPMLSSGSSPRVRGAGALDSACTVSYGIIPARAGSRS